MTAGDYLRVAVLLAAAITSPAVAQDTDAEPSGGGLSTWISDARLSGTARLDYFQSSRVPGAEGNLYGGTLQLKALPRFSDAVDGKVELRGTDSDIRDTRGDADQSRLLEAYVTIHFAKADLRLGNQIVAWGRADGINPTDNLTPHDYVVLLPLEEDQRFGTTAAKLDVYLSPQLTLTAFATPFFQPSKFPLPPGESLIETRPADTASNGEVALKLNRTGGDIDWSVSYFHGNSLLPNVAQNASANELRYDHVDVVGADVARNFGRFGLRSEIAYSRPADTDNADPNVGNPRLFWVGGIDRTLLENLNINLQVFARWMPQYVSPTNLTNIANRNVATLNSIIDAQEASISRGLTFRVSDKWFNDTLEAEILAVINSDRGDYFARPLLTYTFTDHVKGLLGGDLYRGGGDTSYGIFRSTSGAFVEIRYGF